jgi:hypothetical protein
MPNTAPVLHDLGVIYELLGQKLNGDDPAVLNNLAFWP